MLRLGCQAGFSIPNRIENGLHPGVLSFKQFAQRGKFQIVAVCDPGEIAQVQRRRCDWRGAAVDERVGLSVIA